MFCHKCGRKVAYDANFCSNCGVGFKAEDVQDKEEKILEGRGKARKKKKGGKLLPLLPPVVSLVLLIGSMGLYYSHETKVNAEVLAMKHTAEEHALNGEYEEAKLVFTEAIEMRPGYHVLRNNLEVVKIAEEVHVELDEVKEQIKEKSFEDAESSLARLREKIARLEGPLIQPLKQELADKDVMIKVGKVNSELDELSTVGELSRKLAVVSSIPSEEGKAVKEQILNRIVQLTVQDAEAELERKQFTRATTLADRGLQYAVNDKRLLSLKDKIEQTRLEFEQAEFERIERAMEAAAKEDLRNKNSALEVEAFTVESDEVGGMAISGEVKNIVSTTVSSITVYYNILSKDKTVLDTGFTTVYPYKLAPGRKGKFEDYYYGIFEDVTVEIENISWIVEE